LTLEMHMPISGFSIQGPCTQALIVVLAIATSAQSICCKTTIPSPLTTPTVRGVPWALLTMTILTKYAPRICIYWMPLTSAASIVCSVFLPTEMYLVILYVYFCKYNSHKCTHPS
jgi:hypothetical protein